MRIGVIGYGWSGSSALVNFLEKNPDYYVYPGELSFMWDSGGVIDLYTYLTRDYSPYTISRKLMEFEQLIKVCSKKRNVLNPNGTNSAFLLNFRDVLFQNLNVEYIEFSQRNVFLNRGTIDHAVFKVKDLMKRRQYPWMAQIQNSLVLAIFRESLDQLFYDLNPENSVMVFDQPCYVDQVELAMDLLQLDFTYVVSRKRSKILDDMIINKSMYGVIRNHEKRNIAFNSSMDFLMSLDLSGKVKLIAFEEFVHYQQAELKDLFPFMPADELVVCIRNFNWEYSRGNA